MPAPKSTYLERVRAILGATPPPPPRVGSPIRPGKRKASRLTPIDTSKMPDSNPIFGDPYVDVPKYNKRRQY